MEAHDVFTQRNEIGDEDPFAGSDFGDWEQGEPSTEGQEPTPVEPLPENPNIESGYDGPVAAEGEVSPNHPAHPQWHEEQAPAQEQPPSVPSAETVPEPSLSQTPPALPDLTPEQAAEEARRYREAHGEGEYAPPPRQASAPAPDLQAPPPPPSPSQAAAAPESTPEAPAPPQAPQSAPAPPQAPASPPAQTPVTEESAGAHPTEAERREEMGDVPIDTAGLPDVNGSTPESLAETPVAPVDGDAPPPDETKDKRGRVTHRRYVILRSDGNGKFTQLDWYENKDRKLVSKGTNGAKRQTVVLSRGTEEALKFGYHVVGSPRDGAELVAVAAAYFQVKTVAPEPPEPMKQRLTIS